MDLFDAISCTAAWDYCRDAFGTLISSLSEHALFLNYVSSFMSLSDLNVYDMSKACTPEQMAETLCYDIMG